jgi:serine/threonine protein kinase
MAPEMFGEHGYTEKADVYSFSMVLCELLTRKPPFHDCKTWEIPDKVIAGERPRIVTDLPNEPKGLSTVKSLCKSCWHRNPSKRPAFAVILSKLEILLKSITDPDREPQS